MNAEMNEGLNEDYRVGAPVFDDEGSFDIDHEVETVESHDDITSQEPVAEPVEQPSETVPINRQRSEEQLKQAREALVKFYEQQPQAPMAEGEGAPPDLREDPVRLVSWMLDRIQKQDAYIREQKEAIRQAEEQHQHDMRLGQFFNSSVQSFQDKTRDFDAAANFLYEARAKELSSWSSLYPEYAQKSTIDAIIKDQLHALVATCAQRDLNPAEEIYRIAQNLGYQNQAVQANDQIAALQSRQNSARTLTASGGGGVTGPMTKQTLDAMPQKEFDAWISNPKNEALFYKIMGADSD
ncbi:hypothetical protein [Bartonella elizabethae]|uniref:Phage protein n=1 Tax=Bartonella elizabethae F9251 = ATCC 49927 TaxID=1094555 RepID=J0RHW8_BAREL|nr:hypothetical protein [Bartonella elizabethae]EJF95594.1 hypothetical protein MEE_00831 [Bartonella elizabethae F9251 = ATCC 49927]VEJ41433.1 Uncharacterised protein [Bartonella elizabethae]